MNIALAQFNPIVGDLTGNAHRTVRWIERAREKGADLVVFPELSVVGYSRTTFWTMSISWTLWK